MLLIILLNASRNMEKTKIQITSSSDTLCECDDERKLRGSWKIMSKSPQIVIQLYIFRLSLFFFVLILLACLPACLFGWQNASMFFFLCCSILTRFQIEKLSVFHCFSFLLTYSLVLVSCSLSHFFLYTLCARDIIRMKKKKELFKRLQSKLCIYVEQQIEHA